MTNLVLLRHGRSMANERRPVENDDDNLLTSEGLADMIGNAIKFKELHSEVKFDVVFCSPLPRAIQTCYNFISSLDHHPIAVNVVEAFKERDFGFEGYSPKEEIEAKYGKGEIDAWFNKMDHVPCGCGETAYQLYDRVVAAYDELVLPELQEGKTVLIVGHYASLGALIARIVDNGPEKTLSRSVRNGLPYLFEVDNKGNQI